jgi:hypothetical protein
MLAEQNAKRALQGDYGPCTQVALYDYGQNSDGTWWAVVSGECSNHN